MNLIERSRQQLLDYVNSGRRTVMYMSVSTYKKLRVEKEKYINISPDNVITVHYINGDIEYINYNNGNYKPYWSQLKTHEWLNTNFKILNSGFIRSF